MYLLDQTFWWWGPHAGFSLLAQNLARQGCPAKVVRPRSGVATRVAGKAYSIYRGSPKRDQRMAAAELEFLVRTRASRSNGHILFLESHLEMLRKGNGSRIWVGTIHQPRKLWDAESLRALRAVRGALVLCDRFFEDFSSIIPSSRLRVVRYGVDTTFFRPGDVGSRCDAPRLLFVGAWLRNTKMLARLVPRILQRFPEVIFDLVVPLHARQDFELASLQNKPSVRWYCNLSDEELRAMYQRATVMFMPMEDGGANNAIVEALACGLPIITTDVGGIRSYGGQTVYPVVANNDDEGCLDLLGQYLARPEFRRKVGTACRAFAEEHLDWAIVAKEHIRAYRFFGLLP